MNLKKKDCISHFTKWKIGLVLQVFCLTRSLGANDTPANSKEPNVSKFNEIFWKDSKISAYSVGYEFDLMSNRKQILSGLDRKFSFSKSKGYFHGPKLGISSDPISGYIKVGKAHYSFKSPDLGTYRGFGFGIGGQATVYDQDNLSVAVELAYFGGRASNKSPGSSTIKENAVDDLVAIPGLQSKEFFISGDGVKYNGMKLPDKTQGLENGNIVDRDGNVIGERRDNNQWYISKKAIGDTQGESNSQEDGLNSNTTSEGIQLSNFSKMKQSLITARVIAKKQIGDFSPYVGLGYTSDKSTFSGKNNSSVGLRKEKVSSQNKNKIGPFIGCNFSKNSKLKLGFEAQLMNRRCFSFSGSYCF